MERLLDWAKRKPGKVLVITHRNGDVDGIASAIAVKRLILKMNKKAEVQLVSPEGVSSQAKKVVELFDERFEEKIPDDEDDYDAIVITDTGHSTLLTEEVEAIKKSKATRVLIDHHPLDQTMKQLVEYAVVDESASSASEMVYRIFKQLGLEPDKKTCTSVALGIMSDSQFLTIARGPTIIAMAELIQNGVDPEKIRSVLRYRRDVSEQIARIKGAERAQFYRTQSWIIGLTQVGSYHASVARALVELGCDIAIAEGETEKGSGQTRGSVRSTQSFYSATKIHLGNDVCKALADRLGGSGGGHPTAGAFTVERNVKEVEKTLIMLIEDGLGERLKKID
ncbi:MAG: DHH family phosphoesterase [Conexivisphaerales archaeon]